MVHGDDFVIVARDDGRTKTLDLLKAHFELKHHTAGSKAGMAKELRVLGRILICHDWGVELGGRPKSH